VFRSLILLACLCFTASASSCWPASIPSSMKRGHTPFCRTYWSNHFTLRYNAHISHEAESLHLSFSSTSISLLSYQSSHFLSRALFHSHAISLTLSHSRSYSLALHLIQDFNYFCCEFHFFIFLKD
jgi:hypothetical protein